MSRKDYRMIARVIYDVRKGTSCCGVENHSTLAPIVEGLARMFVADNPRFDREKFVKACETGEGC